MIMMKGGGGEGEGMWWVLWNEQFLRWNLSKFLILFFFTNKSIDF